MKKRLFIQTAVAALVASFSGLATSAPAVKIAPSGLTVAEMLDAHTASLNRLAIAMEWYKEDANLRREYTAHLGRWKADGYLYDFVVGNNLGHLEGGIRQVHVAFKLTKQSEFVYKTMNLTV